jgi:hypothetical protein
MKQIVLPALAAVCGAAIAYAAGPNSPVQLAQVQQYKDTTQFKEAPAYKMDKGAPPGAYKMDKGPGQGSLKMEPGAQGQFKSATPPGAQRGATDQDHKGWSSSGAQGQYKAPGGQALKGEGPQGAPGQYYKAPGPEGIKGERSYGAQPQYQRPDKDHKAPLYGQQPGGAGYGQQKMGPGGQPGGFGQDAFPK